MRGQSVLPYSVRPLEWDDIDQVAAIERQAFPTLWPPTSYRRELKNRLAEYLVCIHETERVAVSPKPRALSRIFRRKRQTPPVLRDLLVGFVGLWFMAGDAHIVAVAVREESRRQGLGELLLIASIELSIARGAQIITLEARVSNEPAKILYSKYGFLQTGLRRAYYADNHEDAAIMTTPPIASPDYQTRFERLKADFEERRGAAVRELL